MHLLVEFATGYTLFEKKNVDEIGLDLIQDSIKDFGRFSTLVSLVSFSPFLSAQHALQEINTVSESICSEFLQSFLIMNKSKDLGVGDALLGGSIRDLIKCKVEYNEITRELIRGIRCHSETFLKQLKKAQLGLGHAYSRSKVKFNVNRVDNMITQSISLLDQLDKDVNTFAMRIREWYGWHFPELIKLVPEHEMYAKLVKLIQNKASLSTSDVERLQEITQDEQKAQQILYAARASMGTDISEVDMLNVLSFTDRVLSLTSYRASLYTYLVNKMHAVAPNLSALIGEVVGARLIAHAGSLTNLAKYPASTVQILGAEKALFRALKTRGNTPKYGLIYHSTFIGRAAQKNKGRISRVLANKVSIAARIDCFIDTPTMKFGEILKEQVEERLRFYEEGITPRTNAEAMATAIKELGMMDLDLEQEEEEVEPQRVEKRKLTTEPETETETPKKKKKEKKAKKDSVKDSPKDSPKDSVKDSSKKKKSKKSKE